MIAAFSAAAATAYSFTILWEDHRAGLAMLAALLVVGLVGRWPLSWQRVLGVGLVWLLVGFVPPLPYIVGPGLALAGLLVVPLTVMAYAFRRLQDQAARSA